MKVHNESLIIYFAFELGTENADMTRIATNPLIVYQHLLVFLDEICLTSSQAQAQKLGYSL